MKTSLLIFTILLFSLISGAFGAWGFINYMHSQNPPLSGILSPLEEKEATINLGKEVTSEQATILDFQDVVISTVENIAPSVVSIVIKKDLIIYRSDPWGFFQQPTGTVSRQVGGGSGFFVKSDGTILTNKHVVADRDADYTVILSDGTEYDARVLALDPINDLAVIQVINSTDEFIPLPIISNTEEIRVGEFGIAVGNALAEFQNSVSLGIVSGKDRIIEAGGESLTGLIQTDAAINPGNSGGPLLDLDGQVMGINTAIVSGANGVGFSIALTQDKIDYMLESIASDNRIKRPFIGINYIQNSPGIAAELELGSDYGAYIIDEANSIVAGSSAEKSGLEPGDIILEISGQKIDGKTTLSNVVQNAIPGDELKLRVLKKSGETQDIKLELGEY